MHVSLQSSFFIFMQFLPKIMPNSRLEPPGLAPLLGNPGSATDNRKYQGVKEFHMLARISVLVVVKL